MGKVSKKAVFLAYKKGKILIKSINGIMFACIGNYRLEFDKKDADMTLFDYVRKHDAQKLTDLMYEAISNYIETGEFTEGLFDLLCPYGELSITKEMIAEAYQTGFIRIAEEDEEIVAVIGNSTIFLTGDNEGKMSAEDYLKCFTAEEIIVEIDKILRDYPFMSNEEDYIYFSNSWIVMEEAISNYLAENSQLKKTGNGVVIEE